MIWLPEGLSERRTTRIQAVLFVCSMNSVRSPMAEALARHAFGRSIYIQSAGIRKDEADAFMVAALAEIGIDASKHKPRTLDELEEWEGLNFDLVITLAPEAHHAALELTRSMAVEVEYWPTPDPTLVEGSRERKMEAYRAVRDALVQKIMHKLNA